MMHTTPTEIVMKSNDLLGKALLVLRYHGFAINLSGHMLSQRGAASTRTMVHLDTSAKLVAMDPS